MLLDKSCGHSSEFLIAALGQSGASASELIGKRVSREMPRVVLSAGDHFDTKAARGLRAFLAIGRRWFRCALLASIAFVLSKGTLGTTSILLPGAAAQDKVLGTREETE